MNQDALWRILGLRGVPPKLINLMSELYSGTESAVRCGDTLSDLFPVVTGVLQGCVLAPTLFSACLDWILGRMSERSSSSCELPCEGKLHRRYSLGVGFQISLRFFCFAE